MKNFKISSYSIVTFLAILCSIAMLHVPATAMFEGEGANAPGGKKVVDRVKAWEQQPGQDGDSGSTTKPGNAENNKKGGDSNETKPAASKGEKEKHKPPISKTPTTSILITLKSQEELEKHASDCRETISFKQVQVEYPLTDNDLQVLADANKSLQHIILSDCSNLKNISPLGKLDQLKGLQLFKCTKITSIDDLGEAPRLDSISLNDCPKLKNLSVLSTEEKFPALVVLNIAGHGNSKTLSKQIEELKSLRSHLKISASQESSATKKTKDAAPKVDTTRGRATPTTPRKRSNSVGDLLTKSRSRIKKKNKGKRKGTEIGGRKGQSKTARGRK